MKFLIWNNERNMWWKARRFGYTPIFEEAGRYSKKEAEEIVNEANEYVDEDDEEAMVPENEARAYQERMYA